MDQLNETSDNSIQGGTGSKHVSNDGTGEVNQIRNV